jgi:hypothetical protein
MDHSRPLVGGLLANPWFAQGLPRTASYIRKAPRLFLSPIEGIRRVHFLNHSDFPCTIRSQFMVVNL